MKKTVETTALNNAAETRPKPVSGLGWSIWFAPALLVLLICFGQVLLEIGRFSLNSDLYSHIVLIPFLTLYLIRTRPTLIPASTPARPLAATFLIAGSILLGAAKWLTVGLNLAKQDALSITMLSFLLMLMAVCTWFIGRRMLRALVFPFSLLIFMVPFPLALRESIEGFLQHGSALVAHVLFKLTGTTVFYGDLIFRLPGITLEVAPECSGIRSSLALLITSLVAGYLFLRTPWKRALLTLIVIPLALLRNGFRVYTIGELCVQIDPNMINSYIHRQGGPIFFSLSLIPFFFLLRILYKSDEPKRPHSLTS
jgi:exosortase C (VPDSG-CTERM-specific)